MAKIYIDNSRFMDFVDAIATNFTELNYGADTWKEVQDGLSKNTCIVFTEAAQDYYNEISDSIEEMLNNTLDLHRDDLK